MHTAEPFILAWYFSAFCSAIGLWSYHFFSHFYHLLEKKPKYCGRRWHLQPPMPSVISKLLISQTVLVQNAQKFSDTALTNHQHFTKIYHCKSVSQSVSQWVSPSSIADAYPDYHFYPTNGCLCSEQRGNEAARKSWREDQFAAKINHWTDCAISSEFTKIPRWEKVADTVNWVNE